METSELLDIKEQLIIGVNNEIALYRRSCDEDIREGLECAKDVIEEVMKNIITKTHAKGA